MRKDSRFKAVRSPISRSHVRISNFRKAFMNSNRSHLRTRFASFPSLFVPLLFLLFLHSPLPLDRGRKASKEIHRGKNIFCRSICNGATSNLFFPPRRPIYRDVFEKMETLKKRIRQKPSDNTWILYGIILVASILSVRTRIKNHRCDPDCRERYKYQTLT